MSLSYGEVAQIVKILDASNCDEVILELEGARLVVRRNGAGEAALPSTPAPSVPQPSVSAPVKESPVVVAAPVAPGSGQIPVATSGITVCAPMVGTFYRRPSPDESPFVEVGSEVAVGDPLCLIEVMKLYTTIQSTEAGRVKAVLAEEGHLVEFDQPLFVIEPA